MFVLSHAAIKRRKHFYHRLTCCTLSICLVRLEIKKNIRSWWKCFNTLLHVCHTTHYYTSMGTIIWHQRNSTRPQGMAHNNHLHVYCSPQLRYLCTQRITTDVRDNKLHKHDTCLHSTLMSCNCKTERHRPKSFHTNVTQWTFTQLLTHITNVVTHHMNLHS